MERWQKFLWNTLMGSCSMVRIKLTNVFLNVFLLMCFSGLSSGRGFPLRQQTCPPGTEHVVWLVHMCESRTMMDWHFAARAMCISAWELAAQDSCHMPGAADIKRLIKAKVLASEPLRLPSCQTLQIRWPTPSNVAPLLFLLFFRQHKTSV